MEDVSLLFVNSKNRDKTLYPSGNSYTLHLTTPIRNITRIDLVSVKIPNTTYNLTATSNIVINTTTNVSMLPGYYTTASFTTEFNSSNQTSVRVNYSTAEGRFLFYGSSLSSLSATGQLSNIIGITTASSFAASSNPAYASNTAYSGMNLIKSANVVDTSTNDYVWLDIEELRTQTTFDAKRIISTPSSNIISDTQVTTTVTQPVPATNFVNMTLTAYISPTGYTNSVVLPVSSVSGLQNGMQVLISSITGSVIITNISGLNVTVSFGSQPLAGIPSGTTFQAIVTSVSIRLSDIVSYEIRNQVVIPNLTGQTRISGIAGSNVTITYDAQTFPGLSVGDTFSAIIGRKTSYQTYEGSTAATSFAMITMDVPNGEIKTFKEKSDYLISNKYPSRVDNLTRLTIKWLDINGLPISFNGLENNSFMLRIHSLRYLPEKDRQMTLPTPVDMSTGVPQRQRMIAIAAILILILGLLIIVFYKPIVADDV